MHDIKLVVCDLDGTLLNDQKIVTSFTADIICKVKALGVSVCLASGRNEQMMSLYEKQIGGCDYMLSDNGALVRTKDKRILHCDFLAERDVTAILKYLTEQRLVFMMYTADNMYFSEGSKKLKQRIADYEALAEKENYEVRLKAKEFCYEMAVNGCGDTAKIVIYEENEGIMKAYQTFVDSLPDVHCESTGYGLLGTFERNVSKKTALEKIMADLGVAESEVCVFGDYENDLSMFSCADYRVCMANATAELKKAASHITCSNNEDGVARFLIKKFRL